MSIDGYRRAAEAMRDTTKWLTAIVPGAGLALIVARFVPRIAEREGGGCAFWSALLLAALALGAAGWIVTLALGVFAVQVPGWGEAVRMAAAGVVGPVGREATALTTKLDSDGVLQLYGYRASTDLFSEVAGDVLAERRPSPAAVTAGVLVVDYAGFQSTHAAFRQFLRRGAIALVVALLALGGAEAALARIPARDDAAQVTTPALVTLRVSPAGRLALEPGLACASPTVLPASVMAWAIGGSIERPLVVIDASDLGCGVVTVRWRREWGAVVPR